MINFCWAIGASIAVSLISLIGIFGLLVNDRLFPKVLFLLVGFAAGALIGTAFLHILPEALHEGSSAAAFLYVIFGFIAFFILEKYFYWRHCHHGVCDIHAFSYLNLIGDSIHNFSDGMVIGASFSVGVSFGVVTTLAIIFHEIPQEISDFGVLVYGGFSRLKALIFNFLSALACILGTVIGFFMAKDAADFSLFILPFVAGGFIYIAACDLIPQLHKESDQKKGAFSMLAFIAGVGFILLAKLIHP